MPERLVGRRTTYGWLRLVAAMSLTGSAEDDVDSLLALCPLPVGMLDLAARRVLAMSPALAELLEVADAGRSEIDLAVLVEEAPKLDDLLELVRGGTIDVYSVRRRLRRRRSEGLEVDSWVVVSDVENRSRALWLVVPAEEDGEMAVREPTAETWPTSVSGLVVGSFDAEWRILRVSVDVERVLGRPIEEMVGRRVVEEVHPEDLATLFAAAADCLADRAAVGDSLRWRHRSGEWVELHCIITRLADDALVFGFAGSLQATEGEGLAGRTAVLERHLWRIAREVEMSGVVAGFSRVPDPTEIPGLSELSGRQWEVLTRLMRGERVPAIAKALFVSQSTVRNHLTEIFRKVGVHSQEELLELLRADDGRPGRTPLSEKGRSHPIASSPKTRSEDPPSPS